MASPCSDGRAAAAGAVGCAPALHGGARRLGRQSAVAVEGRDTGDGRPGRAFRMPSPSMARRRPLRAPWFARAPSKDSRPRAGTAPPGRRESVRNVHARARLVLAVPCAGGARAGADAARGLNVHAAVAGRLTKRHKRRGRPARSGGVSIPGMLPRLQSDCRPSGPAHPAAAPGGRGFAETRAAARAPADSREPPAEAAVRPRGGPARFSEPRRELGPVPRIRRHRGQGPHRPGHGCPPPARF